MLFKKIIIAYPSPPSPQKKKEKRKGSSLKQIWITSVIQEKSPTTQIEYMKYIIFQIKYRHASIITINHLYSSWFYWSWN